LQAEALEAAEARALLFAALAAVQVVTDI